MGAMDIAVESVWLLKYSSSIGLGCDASILAVLHVRIGDNGHRTLNNFLNVDLDWPWIRKNNGNLNFYQ